MIRARSYLGYPPVRAARPNVSHYSLTALHHHGFVHKLITQNVDGLHSRSGFPMEDLLELHGTLFVVRCRHGHEIDRDEFQNILSTMNPSWKAFVDEMAARGESLRTNPDGDVCLILYTMEQFFDNIQRSNWKEDLTMTLLSPLVRPARTRVESKQLLNQTSSFLVDQYQNTKRRDLYMKWKLPIDSWLLLLRWPHIAPIG
ncbi:hypothetical protein FRC15_009691 [Serendipita sp. 397]|nr:hypothetical protein FRC15_009691 [Serendipita sp. 397]